MVTTETNQIPFAPVVCLKINSGVDCLKCWIGFHSVTVKEFHLKECTDLAGFKVPGVERSWGTGIEVSDGTESEFVCSKTPLGGTLIKVRLIYSLFSHLHITGLQT